MKPILRVFLIFTLIGTFLGCNQTPTTEKVIFNHDILSECNLAIQNAVVLDGIPPPVASRRYFYATLAAYEAVCPFDPNLTSTVGQFNGFKSIPKIDTALGICLDLAALQAYTKTARDLVYKEDPIDAFYSQKISFYKGKLNKSVFNHSISWGDSISKAVINWANKDTFAQIRGTDFYLAKNDVALWQPTPKEFIQAIEPQWKKIRPSFLTSGHQFFDSLPKPSPYSEDKNSNFYAMMQEVYKTVVNVDSLQLLTARYWDDNPSSTVHYGHATIKVLKVSPAGHWLSLFSTVAREQNYNLFQSAEGMLRMSSVMFDGFIAVWDAKYIYEYIRPVTAIQRLIDSSWLPAIETPSFPEYPSAHSVVSSAAATVLTHLFGEYAFTDSTEFEFGLGVRHYKNFREASNEACMSRIYGGIHFREGMEYGKNLGNAVGNYHNRQLKTRRN
jgi:hypothetical protein